VPPPARNGGSREGELITWFPAILQPGIRRWAAVYKYEGRYYGQSTDAGQRGSCSELSGAFGATISDVDSSSLEIGGISIPANGFIQLLKGELRAAKYGIPGLDSERIKALAEKIFSGDHIGKKARGDATLDEFLRHRELANAVGSTFKPWPGEDPEEWEGNFLDLLNEHGTFERQISCCLIEPDAEMRAPLVALSFGPQMANNFALRSNVLLRPEGE
jgi:hypothetical protein